MQTLHIKGCFWSAGTQYGWPNSKAGVGIAMYRLTNGSKYLLLTIGKDETVYELDVNHALYLIAKYKSYYTTPSGLKLGVVPRDILKVHEPNAKNNYNPNRPAVRV